MYHKQSLHTERILLLLLSSYDQEGWTLLPDAVFQADLIDAAADPIAAAICLFAAIVAAFSNKFPLLRAVSAFSSSSLNSAASILSISSNVRLYSSIPHSISL